MKWIYGYACLLYCTSKLLAEISFTEISLNVPFFVCPFVIPDNIAKIIIYEQMHLCIKNKLIDFFFWFLVILRF